MLGGNICPFRVTLTGSLISSGSDVVVGVDVVLVVAEAP